MSIVNEAGCGRCLKCGRWKIRSDGLLCDVCLEQDWSLLSSDHNLAAASSKTINTPMLLESQLMVPQICPQAQLAFFVKASAIGITDFWAYPL